MLCLHLASFIFLSFFAFNIQTLLAGQILCGLSWGIFSTLTTTYAAEVMPLNLRGYLTANVNLCWLLGQIIALGTLRGLLHVKSEWSYRIPFGLAMGLDSGHPHRRSFRPRIAVVVGQERAKSRRQSASLLRLTRRDLGFDVDATVTMMEHTNEAEKAMSEGRTKDLSYLGMLPWNEPSTYRDCMYDFHDPKSVRTAAHLFCCLVLPADRIRRPSKLRLEHWHDWPCHLSALSSRSSS